MPTDHIRYDLLVQDALRSVVRKVLGDAARNGLPGDHHFYISFKTQAPGVTVPAAMRQKYPDEMTIILQHEFWDLSVNGEGFEVSLSFSRKPERLAIPFAAITGFSDPSVPTFGFKFMVPEVAELGSAPPAASPKLSDKDKSEPEAPRQSGPGPAPSKSARPRQARRSSPADPPASAESDGENRAGEGRFDRRVSQEVTGERCHGRGRQSSQGPKASSARTKAEAAAAANRVVFGVSKNCEARGESRTDLADAASTRFAGRSRAMPSDAQSADGGLRAERRERRQDGLSSSRDTAPASLLRTRSGVDLRRWPRSAPSRSTLSSPKSTPAADRPICHRRSAFSCSKAPLNKSRWPSDRTRRAADAAEGVGGCGGGRNKPLADCRWIARSRRGRRRGRGHSRIGRRGFASLLVRLQSFGFDAPAIIVPFQPRLLEPHKPPAPIRGGAGIDRPSAFD